MNKQITHSGSVVYRLLCFLLLAVVSSVRIYGQSANIEKSYTLPIFNTIARPANGTSQDFLSVSPQAGSLGQYGQVPVSLFTGIAEISVPLHEVKYKELSLPLSLSYHASGSKPDLFPGTVGLGWTLNAGGVVTRVIKGEPDYGDIPTSESQGDQMLATIVEDLRKNDDWASTSNLNYPVKYKYGLAPVTDPDEFYFNLNGRCGHFYLNPDGSFAVSTSDGGCFSVSMDVGSMTSEFEKLPQTRQLPYTSALSPYSNQVTFPEVIRGFTLTDEKGVKYVFGGSLRSVEFSRPGFDSDDGSDYPRSHIQAMSWYLVSMESPAGYRITFDYEQHTYVTQVCFTDMAGVQIDGRETISLKHNYDRVRKATLINGCYLSRIDYPGGTIRLNYSAASEQLEYPVANEYSPFGMAFDNFHGYADVRKANTGRIFSCDNSSDSEEVRNRFWPYKLDGIVVSASGSVSRSFSFKYTANRSNRLKLEKVQVGPEEEHCAYRFEYNPAQMPGYFSDQTDYYGFYNGVFSDMQAHKDTINVYTYVRNNPGCWERIKHPCSPTCNEAEMLKVVRYPTGGYTRFIYEGNDYGCQAKQWPFMVESNGSEGTLSTGGLRIKRVETYDAKNVLQKELRYHYVKNYATGGKLSSGVLAYVPQYEQRYSNVLLWNDTPEGLTQSRRMDFFLYFSSNPVFPLSSTQGSHVTYSEVAVEEPGNGYTVYTFKNFDNGYHDRAPLNQVCNTLTDADVDASVAESVKYPLWRSEEGQSLHMERGQLLSEKVYDKDGVLKRETAYSYNDDPLRFDEGVRYIHVNLTPLDQACQIRSRSVSAGLHYTYYPYLKEKRVTDYLNEPYTCTERYAYTANRLLKSRSMTDSRGRINELTRLYVFEDTVQAVHASMTAAHMLDYPVKEDKKLDGVLQESVLTEYASGLAPEKPSLILPYRQKTQAVGYNPVVEQTVLRCDSLGNPLELLGRSGEHLSCLWSMGGTRLAALVNGIGYGQLSSLLGDSFIRTLRTGNRSAASVHADIRKALSDAGLRDVLVSTFCYDPLNGVSEETDESGLTTYYSYDSLGRLSEVYRMRNKKKEIITSYYYNYAH